MISNIRNVQYFTNETPTAYICDIDLTLDGVTETAKFVARASDRAATGKYVYQQILTGNYSGELTEFVPPANTSVSNTATANT